MSSELNTNVMSFSGPNEIIARINMADFEFSHDIYRINEPTFFE